MHAVLSRWLSTCQRLRLWIGSFALTALILLIAPRVAAQTPAPHRAVVLVDATDDPATNTRIRDALAARLTQAGYSVVSEADTAAQLAARGGVSDGLMTRNAALLAQVRNALGAVLLVRVARASGGFDWVAADITLYSLAGSASTSSAAKLGDAPNKITEDVAPLIPSPSAAATPPPVPAASPGATPETSSTPSTLEGTANSQQSELDVKHRRFTAEYERDCAKDPTKEICKEKGNVKIDKHGLKFGWSKESVTRVKTPPSSSVNFSLDGSFVYGRITMKLLGSSSTSEFYGGGVSLGAKTLFGQQFPGADGGSWFGVGIDPAVAVSGSGGKINIPAITIDSYTEPASSQGFGELIVDGGVSAVVQWLYFGGMDPTTLKQSGFGLNVGYHLGVQYSDFFSSGSSGSSSTSVSQGPVFGMTFPDYNAGTAKLQRTYIQGMIIPTSNLLVVTIAAGFAF
jgi:hypothetical protein